MEISKQRWLPALALLIGCGGAGADAPAAPLPPGVAASAEQTAPLKAGAALPALSLRDADGKAVDLRAELERGPAILIYYRGGWCPYCNAQLGELKKIESELKGLGFQVLAISPDRPEKLRESREELDPGYRLLSDSSMEGARALGIAFRVSKSYRSKLKLFGIDIEGASGEKHHLLPVPSVFVVKKGGTIAFVHSDPNYKVRLDNAALLAAAKRG